MYLNKVLPTNSRYPHLQRVCLHACTWNTFVHKTVALLVHSSDYVICNYKSIHIVDCGISAVWSFDFEPI